MANAIEQIYGQLASVFGGTDPNQFFCMLMPGTVLNPSDYTYDTTRLKPALVAEAESRLVDQMFDVAQVVGSSNGQRVSNQYMQALSVLVPKFDPVLPQVKNALRLFINTPMPAGTMLEGAPFSGTFQAYYFGLYQKWIDKKSAWDDEQEKKKEELSAVNVATANEEFLEWYEAVAEGRLAEIDAAMGKVLAVFSPTDMDAILGALAAGPGGEIEEAREMVLDLRLPSPSGGYNYPVDLLPTNWALDLQSDLNPVDLLKDPEFIAATIAGRRDALQSSISQIQSLLNQSTSPTAMKAVVQGFKDAHDTYNDAESNLLDTYAANTASAAEMYIAKHKDDNSKANQSTLSEIEGNAKKVSKAKGDKSGKGATTKKGTPLTVEDVQKLLDGQNKLIKAQSGLRSSSEALAAAGMNLASAQAQSYGQLPALLARVQSQLGDLDNLRSQLNDSTEADANRVPIAVRPSPVDPAPAKDQVDKVTTAIQTAGKATDISSTCTALGISPAITVWMQGTFTHALTAITERVGALEGKSAADNAQSLVAVAQKAATPADAATAVQKAFDALDSDVQKLLKDIPSAAATAAKAAGATTATVVTAINSGIAAIPQIKTYDDANTDLKALETYLATPATADFTGFATKITANLKGVFSQTDLISAATEALTDWSGAPQSNPSDTSNRYMDFKFAFSSSSMRRKSESSASFKQTSWSVDLFFGSASGSSSSASAASSEHDLDSSTAIEIGMKATKVDIQRGWLDPGIFKLSKLMNRLSAVPVTAGPLPTKPAKDEDTDPTIDWPSIDKLNSAVFPCFPVAFVIAKDITIKFKASASSLDTMHSVLDSKSAAGGGFLCFSVSSSSSSHSESSSMATQSSDTVFSITIPGPQILGWFLELTPPDRSDLLQPQTPTAEGGEMDILTFVAALRQISAASKS
jgi:hypothetical protein